MPVLVEQVTKTKSGKAFRVLLGGKWYNAFIDSGIDAAQGCYIEAEITTSEKFGPGISKWTYSNAAPQGQPSANTVGTPPPGPSPSGPAAAALYDERNTPPETTGKVWGSNSDVHFAEPAKPGDNLAPWFWPSVSNICAAAIEKGLITRPEDLNMWALKWAQVSVSVKEVVK